MNRLVAVSVVLSLMGACEQPRSRYADLAFWFDCDARTTPELERRIESFLSSQNFRVLNLGEILRTHHIPTDGMKITGIDAEQRIIEVKGFASLPGKHAVGLYSRPPTNRDAQLEAQLLSFASEELGCSTYQVARDDNDALVLDMYEADVRRIEGLFQQAAELTQVMPNKSLERTREE